VLEDAVSTLHRAVGQFDSSRSAAAAWRDDQRTHFDRSVLDPLSTSGRQLLATLQRCAAACTEARSSIIE
jgi:hypothetical protein